jgi:RimJ/RimL family protein N-acetyltransferase
MPFVASTRLVSLAEPVVDDFPAYARLHASLRAQYMGAPFARWAAWGIFCHDVACWEMFGHSALMVDLRATGECAGQVGINHGSLFPEKELGWLVDEEHEGRGYATEAARTLRDWAAQALRLDGLASYVDPENRRSAAVAERLGATLDSDAPKQDPGDLVYRHLADTSGAEGSVEMMPSPTLPSGLRRMDMPSKYHCSDMGPGAWRRRVRGLGAPAK